MKVLIITCSVDVKFGGWGRYSADLISALREKNVEVVTEVIPQPLQFKKHFFLGWWQALKLCLKYKDQNFDVIHCVVEPYAFATSIFARVKKTKYILTLHGTYGIFFFTHPFYNLFQRYAYKHTFQIVVVSRYTERRLREFIKPKNVTVIPNGFNFYQSDSRVSTSNKEELTILSIGGVKERKGYHVVLGALAGIKDSLGEFKYYIVGADHDPVYSKRLRDIIHTRGLDHNVVIAGSISADEKEKLYGQADVFILTSLSGGPYFEGFGLVYLEAGAHGVPVIGSLESGAEDAIKDGETGLLVPQNDQRSLEETILKILTNKDVAQKMSEKGVEWARNHDWSIIALKYLEVYRAVLNNE